MEKIIVASGPVIVEDNKVLLDQHGDTEFWKFCGGRAEDKEKNLKEVAKKRAKEEMGIDIEILDENPFLMYTKKTTPEGDIDVLLVHYLAKKIGEINPGEEIRKWQWLEINDLPENELAPNIIPALKHFGFID